eukprot:UN27597
MKMNLPSGYFPEAYLTDWFQKTFEEDVPIWTFPRKGYKYLKQAYELLVDHLKPDAVVLVDGGTDSLMKGDEYGIGSVEEDYSSLLAVHDIKT